MIRDEINGPLVRSYAMNVSTTLASHTRRVPKIHVTPAIQSVWRPSSHARPDASKMHETPIVDNDLFTMTLISA